MDPDFYVNQKLSLKMDLPSGRESVLDMFDRIRKEHPGMERFRRYDDQKSKITIEREFFWRD